MDITSNKTRWISIWEYWFWQPETYKPRPRNQQESQPKRPGVIIYIIITKNIRYLLWNRGAWHFFHDTYLTIEVQGIRCTNQLHDSCPFTGVNPHFTAPECWYHFKINSWWPIVTSWTHGPAASYCDVTMAHCSHGYLWRMMLRSASFAWCWGWLHFRTPVFQHGASLVVVIIIIIVIVIIIGTNSFWFPLARKWPTWNVLEFQSHMGRSKKIVLVISDEIHRNPRDLKICIAPAAPPLCHTAVNPCLQSEFPWGGLPWN